MKEVTNGNTKKYIYITAVKDLQRALETINLLLLNGLKDLRQYVMNFKKNIKTKHFQIFCQMICKQNISMFL